MWTTNFYKSFSKNILLYNMSSRLWKIDSVHTNAMPRTVYFGWICTFKIHFFRQYLLFNLFSVFLSLFSNLQILLVWTIFLHTIDILLIKYVRIIFLSGFYLVSGFLPDFSGFSSNYQIQLFLFIYRIIPNFNRIFSGYHSNLKNLLISFL